MADEGLLALKYSQSDIKLNILIFPGIHIINLGKTWEKLVFAARIIAAIENVSSRGEGRG